MGKCLVTKLKEVVQNVNLPYLGELKIKLVKQGTSTDDIVITCLSEVSWKSTVNLYDSSSKNVNYGKSGNFTGTRQFFFEEEGELIIHPMYSMTELTIHGSALVDLSTVYTNTGALNMVNGGGYAERGSNIRTNINITSLSESYPQAYIPIIFDGDYSKITVESSVTKLIIGGGVEFGNKILAIGKVLDLSVFGSMPNKELVTTNLFNFSYEQSQEVKDLVHVSNIEAFSGFVNAARIELHNIRIESGSVVTALSRMTELSRFTIYGNNTFEDLADLFNAWKSAGKHDSSCTFWLSLSKYKVTGYPNLSSGAHTVTFDANGNWTVV